jgi:hypothetical protein
MEASELRVGSIIWFKNALDPNGFAVVNMVHPSIIRTDQGEAYINQCIPIPLNEEWLKRFGFELSYTYDNESYFVREGFDILSDYGATNFIIGERFGLECGYYENFTPCKHVHQLQNLYFALAGSELTLSGGE